MGSILGSSGVETYSLESWSLRRVAGEAKEWLESNSAALSWGEALRSPPLLAFKALTTGAAHVLPDKPRFEQLGPLDKDVGAVLDVADDFWSGQRRVRPFGVDHVVFPGRLAQFWTGGVVWTWPAVLGQDP